MQTKVYIDKDLNRDRMPLVHGRLEFVLSQRFHCHFIQPHPEAMCNADILRISLRIHDQLERDLALKVRCPCLICKFGPDRLQDLRRTYAATHVHQSAAISSSTPWARSD